MYVLLLKMVSNCCSVPNAGKTWLEMATKMSDSVMLTRLETGDTVANDVKYHHNCLPVFFNKFRSWVRAPTSHVNVEEEMKKKQEFF